ncbi:RND family efflux transporter, MFP subunit [Paracoccus isoporae]|uniref:RND family efflux transporter, MFP subunit n=1 Tax=Paracoccus isoporae TaxID=591205 RepID=A0A1G7AG90_9RHOB|nr:efflux RND transporter periplasmic adaptor subunit [Paracoccus isoporae]SDE13723.1 RND family efflux transporter, MFP subunit [Paracoccus isoporae]
MLRIFLALLLSAATPAIADDAEQGESAAPGSVQARQSATVVDARIAPVEIRVPVSGSLVPRQEALVYPQLSGYEVTEVLAEIGDEVSRGDVLARLSDLTVRAQLAQAEAEAERAEAGVGQARSQIDSAEATAAQAEASLARTQRLQRGGTATQAALDDAVAGEAAARAAVASARDGLALAIATQATAAAAVEIARLNLQRTEIRAPVDGIVTGRNARIGALGNAAGEPMFEIVAAGEIEWEAEVIETALGALSLGDPAIASVAGLGAVEGEVRLLPATVDQATRLGRLRIAMDATEGLKPGLFASGWVITDRHDGVTVPLTAVLAATDGEIVQVVSDGVIETRPVLAGAIWQGRREILRGLEEGETVVARAGAFFRDGDQIDAVRAADNSAASGADTAEDVTGAAGEAQAPAATETAANATGAGEAERASGEVAR